VRVWYQNKMADEILAGDRTTTSLWIDPDSTLAGESNHAKLPTLSLTGAGSPAYETVPYETVPYELKPPEAGPLARPLARPPHVDEDTKMVTVQFRKRSGKLDVLIDGLLSTGSDSTVKTLVKHRLHWHRGLHKDQDSNTSVFSPLAVVLAFEDGQRPPHDCRVQVWQTLNKNGILGSKTEPLLLGEKRLEPHSVFDPTCDVVVVPYPLSFCRPPSVIIYDLSAVNQKKYTDVMNEATMAVAGVASSGVRNYAQYSDIDFTTVLATTGVGAVLYAVAVGCTHAGYPILAIGAQTLAPLSDALLKLFNAGEEPVDRIAVTFSALQAVFTNVRTYLGKDRSSKHSKVRFTLPKLATSLESLAAVTTLSPGDLKGMLDPKSPDRVSLRYEMTIWSWLLVKKAPKEMTEEEMIKNNWSANEINTEDLAVLGGAGIETLIRVMVNDLNGCNGEISTHEFSCAANDADELGLVATGTLRDLKRVSEAIAKLDSALEDAINGGTKDVGVFTSSSWWDYYIWNGIWKALRGTVVKDTPLTKNLKESWFELQLQRVNFLKQVREGVRTKLNSVFVDHRSKGKLLEEYLENRLQRSFHLPKMWTKEERSEWVRQLPQRIQSPRFLFPVGRNMTIEHLDAETAGVVTREFTTYHDILGSYNEAVQKSRIALARLVKEWEGLDSKVTLRCLCKKEYEPPLAPGKSAPVTFSSLILALPMDVRNLMETTQNTEKTVHWLSLVTEKIRQKRATGPTLWDRLSVRNTEAEAASARVFGDIWAHELVDLFRVPNLSEQEQVTILQSAARRSVLRLRAASAWLYKVTQNNEVGIPMRYDPGFLATQPGRDAARIVDESLLFSSEASVWMRKTLCPHVRATASAAKRLSEVFERSTPTTLPLESLATLFGTPIDGLAAVSRITRCLEATLPGNADLAKTTLAAVAASYSSNLLLQYAYDQMGRSRAKDRETVSRLPSLQPRPTSASLSMVRNALQTRAATLRVGGIEVSEMTRRRQPTIEGLVDAMTSLDLKAATFYVPFGYGGKPPHLSMPAVAAPMFGTVPVYAQSLEAAFGSLKNGLTGLVPTPGASFVKLVPFGTCAPDEDLAIDAPESMHPMLMKASKKGLGVEVHFQASGSDTIMPEYAASGIPLDLTAGIGLASDHVEDDATRRLRADICCIAWNAERVHQALLLAVACASDDMNGIDVAVEVPNVSRIAPELMEKMSRPDLVTKRRILADRLEKQRGNLQIHARAHLRILQAIIETVKNRFRDGDDDGWVGITGAPVGTSDSSLSSVVIQGESDDWLRDEAVLTDAPITDPFLGNREFSLKKALAHVLGKEILGEYEDYEKDWTEVIDLVLGKKDATSGAFQPKKLETNEDLLNWRFEMTWFDGIVDQFFTGSKMRKRELRDDGKKRLDAYSVADVYKQALGKDINDRTALKHELNETYESFGEMETTLQELQSLVPGLQTTEEPYLETAKELYNILNTIENTTKDWPKPELVVAERETELRNEWTRRMITASIGIGLAMTHEIVGPELSIRVRGVANHLVDQKHVESLEDLFRNKENTLRLSEVCVITRAVLCTK